MMMNTGTEVGAEANSQTKGIVGKSREAGRLTNALKEGAGNCRATFSCFDHTQPDSQLGVGFV